VGEIVIRFFLGSLYRFGHFSGDPQPGNFLLATDGRVAFLDFGMTKKVPRSRVASELAVLRAGLEQDALSAHAGLAALGFFEPHDLRFDPSHVLDHVRALNAWYASDEPVTLTPEYVSGLLAHAGDPRSPYWELMRNETLPSPNANWHRIMSEWICGSPPSSPLGTAEAEFFAARLGYACGANPGHNVNTRTLVRRTDSAR
jgi:hypothetical protein